MSNYSFSSSTLHCVGYSSNSTSDGRDAWQHMPFTLFKEDGSATKFIFEAQRPRINNEWLMLTKLDVEYWEKVLEMRIEVNKVLEMARGGKLIGLGLDAKVYLCSSKPTLKIP